MSSGTIALHDESCPSLVSPHIPEGRADEIRASLEAIHAQFAREQSAGAATLEENWRAWTVLHQRRDLIERSLQVAEDVREGPFDSYVHVGVGGSDLGPRVCHEVLNHTLHNELEERGAPRVYFTGDTFDPRPLRELLGLLRTRGELFRTAFNVVSKSGRTPETLCALLAIKESLGEGWAEQVILTTAEDANSSILYKLTESREFLGVLPVPEGVGGRFSVASPVGLVPLAVSASGDEDAAQERLEEALAGYGHAHDLAALQPDDPANVAFRLAEWLQYAEEQLGLGSLVFYDYSACRMLGDWLVQLYTESIQERGGGLNVIAARGPTSNHSLLNGIISGPRDKIVLFLDWGDLGKDLQAPMDPDMGEAMRVFMGRDLGELQSASQQGTIRDFAAKGVPCLRLAIPRRDAYHLFFVMRVLMDTVAVKGRLQGLHIGAESNVDLPSELTYQQAGVEGSKQAMREFLGKQGEAGANAP